MALYKEGYYGSLITITEFLGILTKVNVKPIIWLQYTLIDAVAAQTLTS